MQAEPRNVEPEIRDMALLGFISTTKGEFTITQVLERSSRSDGILMKSQYYEWILEEKYNGIGNWVFL